MSIEPGERRRRRELERARELAAQDAADGSGAAPATPSASGAPDRSSLLPTTAHAAQGAPPAAVPAPTTATPAPSEPPPSQPLTRRELRELEAARAAGTSAPAQSQAAQPRSADQQQQPAPQPTAAQPQAFVPAAPARADQPATPPSSPSPFISRRAMREAAPVTPPPPGAPVRQTAVRPPASGAMRGLDEQGGLGEVRPATGANQTLPQGHFAQVQPASPKRAPGGVPQGSNATGRPNPAQPHSAQPGAVSPGQAPTQAVPRPGRDAPLGSGPSSTAARPEVQGSRRDRAPGSPVAPGVPVPPVVRHPQAAPGLPTRAAPFVPARPDGPDETGPQHPHGPSSPRPNSPQPFAGQPHAGQPVPSQPHHGPQPGPQSMPSNQWAPSGALAAPPVQNPAPGRRSHAPTPESGWTPAVSGAVRAPVEPGTLPPGVVAPVSEVPPAGTFIPTGAIPIVPHAHLVAVGGGAAAQQAQPAPAAWGTDPAAPAATPASGTDVEATAATPAWGRLGVSPEDVEDEEPQTQHGYTWLHMIVLALVAFVAGLLVWLLLIQGRGAGGMEGMAEGLAEPATGSVGAAFAVVDTSPGEL